MPEQVPTVGRSVHYTLTEDDCREIASQRAGVVANVPLSDGQSSMAIVDVWYGNTHYLGDTLPMGIVAVNSNESVNGQVVLDGNDVLWKSSAMYTTDSDGQAQIGCWHWPPRV